MEWWRRKVKFPTRKIWSRVGTRLGIRKSGLPKLRNEIRSCEYEDVHRMWGMLHPNEKAETIQLGGGEGRGKKRRLSNIFYWFKRGPPACRGF